MPKNVLSPASEQRLCDLYQQRRSRVCDLALIFGVSRTTVHSVLKRNGFPLLKRGERLKKVAVAKPWNDDFVSYHHRRAITRRKAR